MEFWNIFKRQPPEKSENAADEISRLMETVERKFGKDAVDIAIRGTVGWQESLRPGALALETLIIEKAYTCLQLIDKNITGVFPTNEQEHRQKMVEVFFEMVSFFAHVTSRVAFKKFGPIKRQKLNDKIGPCLVEFTIGHFYKPISKDKDVGYESYERFKQFFYDYLDASEQEYASCTAWTLKEDEDISYADKSTGKKSKGIINLLSDNIAGILSVHNPITYLKIRRLLITSFTLLEFEEIVSRVENEI